MQDNEIQHAGEPVHVPLQCPANPPPCILVVNDDASTVLLYRDALVHHGYRVDTAGDGAAGWEALQTKSYDLLITDNNMPKLTGVEMVKKLRGKDTALPVILASGTIPTEELKRHPWLQFAAILLKPFTLAELLVTVEKVLHAGESTPSRTTHKFHSTTGDDSQPGSLRHWGINE